MSPTGGEALSLIGLARRAGSLTRGTGACRAALRAGQVHLLVIAADASPGQLEKIVPLARSRGIPIRTAPDQASLGRAAGEAPLTAVAVNDPSLARRVMETLPAPEESGEGE